ncbi:Hypothetical protein SMAX5B_021648 [Scophthalmus maximus]|uniref:Uncharacterized protein n=1 Tax=Scophthalmus maximus TaxID=52904 RepID=A0A2U9CAB2_SCOMX|nr:Hypothetical protein SMAX5B_021648 [Scophthalmus maximus]
MHMKMDEELHLLVIYAETHEGGEEYEAGCVVIELRRRDRARTIIGTPAGDQHLGVERRERGTSQQMVTLQQHFSRFYTVKSIFRSGEL